MLSVFPELFTYSLIAPLILRLAIGCYFLFGGIRKLRENKDNWNNLWSNSSLGSLALGPILAKIQIVIGIFLLAGLYTQIAAILAIVFAGAECWKRHRGTAPSLHESWPTIFVIAISLALLFLGAGFLAFDLPL